MKKFFNIVMLAFLTLFISLGLTSCQKENVKVEEIKILIGGKSDSEKPKNGIHIYNLEDFNQQNIKDNLYFCRKIETKKPDSDEYTYTYEEIEGIKAEDFKFKISTTGYITTKVVINSEGKEEVEKEFYNDSDVTSLEEWVNTMKTIPNLYTCRVIFFIEFDGFEKRVGDTVYRYKKVGQPLEVRYEKDPANFK